MLRGKELGFIVILFFSGSETDRDSEDLPRKADLGMRLPWVRPNLVTISVPFKIKASWISACLFVIFLAQDRNLQKSPGPLTSPTSLAHLAGAACNQAESHKLEQAPGPHLQQACSYQDQTRPVTATRYPTSDLSLTFPLRIMLKAMSGGGDLTCKWNSAWWREFCQLRLRAHFPGLPLPHMLTCHSFSISAPLKCSLATVPGAARYPSS